MDLSKDAKNVTMKSKKQRIKEDNIEKERIKQLWKKHFNSCRRMQCKTCDS